MCGDIGEGEGSAGLDTRGKEPEHLGAVTVLHRTGGTSGHGCPRSGCVCFLPASSWQGALFSDCCRYSEEGKCWEHTMAGGGRRRQVLALTGPWPGSSGRDAREGVDLNALSLARSPVVTLGCGPS